MRLTETGADGFVPVSTLGDEYFRFEEKTRALVGTRTRSFPAWRPVEARLVEAVPFAGALSFEMVSGDRIGGRAAKAGAVPATVMGARPVARADADERYVPFPQLAAAATRPPARRGDPPRIHRTLSGLWQGAPFRGYLKLANACIVCGEELNHARADDAPAYLTMLIVCHLVGAGVLFSDEVAALPLMTTACSG